jgi:hypothetical protein
MELNKSQMEQFVRTLQQVENQFFNNGSASSTSSVSGSGKVINPKLTRLNDRKIKMTNKLKYDVMAFIRLLDEIEEETKNPSKAKAVGI